MDEWTYWFTCSQVTPDGPFIVSLFYNPSQAYGAAPGEIIGRYQRFFELKEHAVTFIQDQQTIYEADKVKVRLSGI